MKWPQMAVRHCKMMGDSAWQHILHLYGFRFITDSHTKSNELKHPYTVGLLISTICPKSYTTYTLIYIPMHENLVIWINFIKEMCQ